MNWLLIGVLAVIILCVMYGYWKGFIRILFSLISIVVLMAFVTISTPYVAKFLEENTSLQTMIEEKCLERIRASAEKNIEDKLESQNTDRQKMLEDAGISLPDGIWEDLLDAGIGATDKVMEQSGMYQTLAENMSHFIVNGIASLAAFIVGVIALFVIARLLNLMSKLPVIREVNHFLGVLAGLMLGLAVVWIFLYLVAIFCTSPFGLLMTNYIQQSVVLTWLYNHNLILYLILMYL